MLFFDSSLSGQRFIEAGGRSRDEVVDYSGGNAAAPRETDSRTICQSPGSEVWIKVRNYRIECLHSTAEWLSAPQLANLVNCRDRLAA